MRSIVGSLLLFAASIVSIPACTSEPSTDTATTESSSATAPGGGEGSGAARSGGGGASSSGDPAPGPLSPERALAAKLGLPTRLWIGLGNDLPVGHFDYTKCDIYTLPTKLDIHYVYLSGLKGQGGWPDHDPNGSYVNMQADIAAARGVVPMFTLYQAAAWGERDYEALQNPSFMTAYWQGAKLLFQRLAMFDKPAIVHLEPDLWGFAQQDGQNDDPASIPVKVGSVLSECQGLPEDISGMSKCLIRLSRTLSPKVAVGLSASSFGAPTAARVGQYLAKLGAAETDLTVVETLDRDAGCFEARVDPNCQRRDGVYYWDDTNTRSPSFKDHLTWAKTIRTTAGKPLLWWQTPLGVPKGAPGGAAGRYRDNRVKYIFEHPKEFVEAGGVGIAFGVGAPNQTTVKTDGGQFSSAIGGYFNAPVPLP